MPDLEIKYTNLKSCFVSIPLKYANIILDNSSKKIALKLIYQQAGQTSTHYVSWSGFCSDSANQSEYLEIDPSFAQVLDIRDKQIVPADFTSVSVEPLTSNDWEVLELNAFYLEDQFLNQVKVVQRLQILNIWVNQISIKVRVTSMSPANNEFVWLDNTSEVIVSPKKGFDGRRIKENCDLLSLIAKVNPNDSLPLLQVTPYNNARIGLSSSHGFAINSLVYIQNFDYDHLVAYKDSSQKSVNKSINGSFVRVVESDCQQLVTLSTFICASIDVGPLSKIRVVQVIEPSIVTKKIIVTTSTNQMISSEEIVGQFKTYLRDITTNEEIILYDGMRFKIDKMSVVIKIENNGTENKSLDTPIFIIAQKNDLDAIDVSHEFCETMSVESKNVGKVSSHIPGMIGYEDILMKMIGLLNECKIGKSFNRPINSGLLLHGAVGCGKTTLLENLAHRLCHQEQYFPIQIQCKKLKNKSIHKIKLHLEYISMKSQWHQPCCVYFDNLEDLLPSQKELSHYFIDLMRNLVDENNIMLVATIPDKSSLCEIVLNSRLFERIIHIKSPDQLQRKAILESMIDCHDTNLDDLSRRMDGYSLIDINKFHQLMLHQSTIRRIREMSNGLAQSQLFSTEDFEKTFHDFKPPSSGVSKIGESLIEWESIGGMNEIKNFISQTLKWPTMYPQIFSKSPIRVKSGILLYGYPGCGKTMLGSAVAKECGLNFISVKGPELLNKYIGASEKAVRDVFERARAAKPCCLFFDEFDSVAPRRGHDNSGVTDRVVNQILTEMDGAEGLEGVYVIGATSRPDMIDPALLRPGRLDTSMLCDLPSEHDRYLILQLISKTIPLLDVDIKLLASKTRKFSGADLQGLMYTAQLDAINQSLSSAKLKKVDDRCINADIIQGDLRLPDIQDELKLLFKAKIDKFVPVKAS